MKNVRSLRIAKSFSRSLPLLLVGSVSAAALGYAAHRPAHQAMAIVLSSRSPFALTGTPSTRRVVAGGRARYRIAIVRGHFRSKILLAATASNPRLSAHLSNTGAPVGRSTLRVSGKRAILTVKTRRSARPGRYTIRVSATAGHFRARLALKLTIQSAPSLPFSVSGNFGELWPGTSSAVNLAVTNPNATPISITRLSVGLKAINAPRATSALPCSTADFSLTQFSGSYPLRVPANTTVPLSSLGVASPVWPRITMLDRPVNQDGCQGAMITLSYTGTATG